MGPVPRALGESWWGLGKNRVLPAAPSQAWPFHGLLLGNQIQTGG